MSITRVRTGDGALVTVATFLGPVRYVLHNGSADPGAAAGAVRAGPVVTGAERRQLLAAFNGGFKLSAGVGGYMQEGHVISPLRRGFASLVIDRSGQARIGVWGSRTPGPGEAVYSVRQNLQPLVLNGRPTAAAADWTRWGAPVPRPPRRTWRGSGHKPYWGSWRRNGSAGRRLVTRMRASTATTPSGRAMTGLRSSSATCGRSSASWETRSRMSRRPS